MEDYHTEKGILATETNYRATRSRSAHWKGFPEPNLPLNLFWLPLSSRLLGKESLLQPPAGKRGEAGLALSIVTKQFCEEGKESQPTSAQTAPALHRTTFLREQWVTRPRFYSSPLYSYKLTPLLMAPNSVTHINYQVSVPPATLILLHSSVVRPVQYL